MALERLVRVKQIATTAELLARLEGIAGKTEALHD
jgi:hypothetical protein